MADKPLSAEENAERIKTGLAKGKIFYLRGGKKMVGEKAGKPEKVAPAVTAKTDEKVKDNK